MLILLLLFVTAIGVIPVRVVTVGLLCMIVFGMVLTVVAVVVVVAVADDVVVAGRTFVIPSWVLELDEQTDVIFMVLF